MIWEVGSRSQIPKNLPFPPKPWNDNKIEIKKTCCFVYVWEIIDFLHLAHKWEMKRETDSLHFQTKKISPKTGNKKIFRCAKSSLIGNSKCLFVLLFFFISKTRFFFPCYPLGRVKDETTTTTLILNIAKRNFLFLKMRELGKKQQGNWNEIRNRIKENYLQSFLEREIALFYCMF